MNDAPRDEKTYWLDDKRNVDKIWYGLLAVCALLFAADAFYHKHVHFEAESWFGFYGVYGFVACVFLVLAARVLRRMLMRSEDYYDKADD
jgi:hypothetical protein